MSEFEVKPNRVLVREWGGSGVQFNQHVYPDCTPGVLEHDLADLHKKLGGLGPQLVRIFYNPQQEGAPSDEPNWTNAQKSKWNSFVRAVTTADGMGSTINVTWQSGPLVTPQDRKQSMRRFADVLDRLVTTSQVENLKWVTIQNEPNTAPKPGHQKRVTPERLGAMYRLLDEMLVEKGLRRQIRFMGGDLIEGSTDVNSPINHRRWFGHMSEHLADIVDAYSVHIYWDYDDVIRFQDRLRDVKDVVSGLAHEKPVYVTEYGVRGKDTQKKRGFTPVPHPGNLHAGNRKIPLEKTNVAAFQHAWFQIMAAQLGFAGVIKWDGFFGKYDKGTQAFYVIGEPGPEGWPLYPTYFLLRLFTATTGRGWRVLDVTSENGHSQQVTAFAGSDGALTVFGLDSRGAQLNTSSRTRSSYTIKGLPPRQLFSLVLWNRAGGGRLVVDSTVTASARGVAELTVPIHSVFALTTVDLSAF